MQIILTLINELLYADQARENLKVRYLYQFSLIMLFVFLGEVLEYLISLPIAGSIYGLVLLFLALVFKIVKLSWVEDVANWFHSIMALFFIAPAVAVIDIWSDISGIWWKLVLLLVAAYLVTMITTGVTAEALIKDKKKKADKVPE
ncbi:MAG: CidA/LrgA family protein [Rickettsiales bacterium]|jgi:holin-like protein|nr:CidA/LrgA family protein [Rickettsiales bacterium]